MGDKMYGCAVWLCYTIAFAFGVFCIYLAVSGAITESCVSR